MKKLPIKSKKVKTTLISAKEYAQVLLAVKKQMLESQAEAIASVNMALNKRNWLLGKIIVEKQNKHKWGSSFIEKLAKDMQNMAPGSEGLSIRNVYRMKAFYEAYENIAAAAAIFEKIPIFRIPWFHNVAIIQNLKNQNERLWYAQKAIEYGWSRSALEDWDIELHNKTC